MVKFGLSSSGSRARTGLDLITCTIKNALFSNRSRIHYIVESADWVIKSEALTLKKHIPEINITSSTFGIKNKVLHFGTSSLFKEKPARSNKSILTYYHIAPQDRFQYRVGQASQSVKIVHTSCDITKQLLINLGVEEEKIVKIHIPVDLDIFSQFSQDKKRELRQRWNIPEGSIVIGSFQKDGIGWGEGNEPKLEKGPDIFCKVVKALSRKYPIHIMLSGPARGYVKAQLIKANISFTHLVPRFSQMVELLNVIDLYLVTSRQEGGPKAVLETMATGVPIVSTMVGQAPEIINSGQNGFLTAVEDVSSLVKYSSNIIDDVKLKQKLIYNGLKTAPKYSAQKISQQIYNQLYLPLL